MYSRPQKLAAEFLGTFAVVLFSAGAVCADQLVRSVNPTGAIGPLGIALAYGFAFASLSAALAHVSGGHFNPAVTIGFWVTRRCTTFDTLAYWLAQITGAVAAAYLLRWVVPEDAWQTVALGTPELASGLTRSPALLIEGLATFVLTFVVFAAAKHPSPGALSAMAGGLAITAGSLFSAPFTGGAMNPARAFGPALMAGHWTSHGVYWVGPLAGGMLAAWTYQAVIARPTNLPD